MEYVLTERRVHLPIFNKTSLLSKKKKKRFKGVRDGTFWEIIWHTNIIIVFVFLDCRDVI